jgi:hypothetical protein
VLASTTTDWITAIGSLFAAVGTVGAVIVALWQVSRQDQRRMRVRCYRTISDLAPTSTSVMGMTGINVGRSPIRVTEAELKLENGEEWGLIEPVGDQLPAVIEQGAELQIIWDHVIQGDYGPETVKSIIAYGFRDSLGNAYWALHPDTIVKRRGWRRTRTYSRAKG